MILGLIYSFNRLQLHQAELLSVLDGLNPKKGADTNNIPAIFVKKCSATLSYPLLQLVKQSLNLGVFLSA